MFVPFTLGHIRYYKQNFLLNRSFVETVYQVNHFVRYCSLGVWLVCPVCVCCRPRFCSPWI